MEKFKKTKDVLAKEIIDKIDQLVFSDEEITELYHLKENDIYLLRENKTSGYTYEKLAIVNKRLNTLYRKNTGLTYENNLSGGRNEVIDKFIYGNVESC